MVKFLLGAILLSAVLPAQARWLKPIRRYVGDTAALLAKVPKDKQGHYIVGEHLVRVGGRKFKITVPNASHAEELGARLHESENAWGGQLLHGEKPHKKGTRPEYLVNANDIVRDHDGPIIGREQEIDQIARALKLKDIKGIVLVGDPGVGKTAVVRELARRIADGELPELADREIFALDANDIWSSHESRWLGQVQNRLKNATDFIEAKPAERILFIDEIHQLLRSGAIGMNDSTPPLTMGFKKTLERGMCCIGATTHDEYQKIIEKDQAIIGRFLRIDINEPSTEGTLKILRGIKKSYEDHHGITITDEALLAALDMSNRYRIDNKKQPRNAVHLLDLAATAVTPGSALGREHIAATIAEKLSLPVETILKNKNDKAAELLPALQAEIFGQEHVHKEIDEFLLMAFMGHTDETRPLASFLFAGPTGTGKTQTAKVIAKVLFGSEDNLITVNMERYKIPAATAALQEFLTSEVKAKPYSVILLDEVDRADKGVLDLLLPLLDEGRLTDRHQRQVNFRNTIIVLTTNRENLARDFAREIRGRLDRTLQYNRLDDQATARLVQKQLDEFNLVLQDRQINLALSAAAVKILAQRGYSQEFGARNMRPVFEKLIKYPVTKGINDGSIIDGINYSIELVDKGNNEVQVVIRVDDDEVVLELSQSMATKTKRGTSAARTGFH